MNEKWDLEYVTMFHQRMKRTIVKCAKEEVSQLTEKALNIKTNNLIVVVVASGWSSVSPVRIGDNLLSVRDGFALELALQDACM